MRVGSLGWRWDGDAGGRGVGGSHRGWFDSGPESDRWPTPSGPSIGLDGKVHGPECGHWLLAVGQKQEDKKVE